MTETDIHTVVLDLALGCCADEAWRGRFCQYHDGYEDGMLQMLNILEPESEEFDGNVPRNRERLSRD